MDGATRLCCGIKIYMGTNHYFRNTNASNEQSLLEQLVIEAIKIHGIDVFYLPRTLLNKDKLYGEDPKSLFATSKEIEMYVENVNGFEGQGDLLSKFGLEVRDSATLVVSKLRFQKETNMLRPLEGDIIYFPVSKGFFEIKFVEHESPFFQLGRNYVFKLTCELFQYNQEKISTGEPEIDSIVEPFVYKKYLTITGNSMLFSSGDNVYQYSNGLTYSSSGYTGADAKGTVYSYDGTTLQIKNIMGNWLESNSISNRYVTNSSNNSYGKVIDIQDTTDNYAINDNRQIQQESDNTLDFDETNPFGDP